jgi:hypothetical protein
MKSHSTKSLSPSNLLAVNRVALTFRFGLFLTVPSLAIAQTATPDAAAQQSAYRSSIAQESVRKQADKIQSEITELVAELKLNGIDGADLAVLTNASGHLQELSQQDMQKVVNALQSASMATQEQGRQQSLVTAYEGQKTVSLKLKSLAVDMAAQEAQKEIPSKLENLIARQSANIRLTSTLASANANSLSAQQKTTHDVITSEQTALGGEVDVFFTALTAAAAAPSAPDAPPDSASAILKAMNGGSLKPVTDAATQATTAGPFPDAVSRQGDVRNALSSLLRLSLSNLDAVSKLQEVKAELEQITNDQKDLQSTTKESKLDGGTLAERQARIGDRASVTQAVLKAVSPAASTQLNEAQQDMNKSASALTEAKNPADTAPQQQAVVDALVKTAALLDTQIAAAQKAQAEAPTDQLAQLEQVKNEISAAQQNPQDAASLQKAQQDAAAVAPQAADKLADAADQLQKSQPDAAAAKNDLAQANTAVQQQEDAMKQSAQAYQALQQASHQLATAQQDAAAAQQAMQQPPASGDLTQAAKDLTQAQQALQQAQQAAAQSTPPTTPPATPPQTSPGAPPQNGQQTAQQPLPGQPSQPPSGLPPDAQQALQQAAAALQAATMQAVQAQSAGAQAQDQKAQAAMQQAQASLGQAMAQVQQQGQQGQGQGQGQQQQQGQQPGGKPMQPGQMATKADAGDAPQSESAVLAGSGAAGGPGQVMGGLKPKDRDAISQFQAEKSPPEYAPLVQQYLKNLADSSQAH